MNRLTSLQDIARLYAMRGGLNYGEGVTQLEHALQCAALAQTQGAAPTLVAAALLHDIGHLLVTEDVAVRSDDRHEITGAKALSGLFGEEVRRPIALHVQAKRYLCFRDSHYFEALSPASQASLKLQGGPFDSGQAAAFEALPSWQDAVTLRRLDDMGKCEAASGLGFAHFAPLLRSVMTGA
jgi:phosphonate degradation associated HDIG domain protein